MAVLTSNGVTDGNYVSTRCWVNFDSAGSVRLSYNVSSVSKYATGSYLVYYGTNLGYNNAPVSSCAGPYFVTLSYVEPTYCGVVANEAAVGPRDAPTVAVHVTASA